MTEEAGKARPLRRRAKILIALVLLGILADAAALIIEVIHLRMLNDLARGVDVSFEEADASDTRVGVAALVQVATYIASVIAFLAWFYRGYSNLPALGANDLRYRSGWAVGSWFVPILNLFRPKQIANDIWRASDPDAPERQGRAWHERGVTPLLHWWWAIWLVNAWVGNAATRMYLDAETVPEQQSASGVNIAADIGFIIAGVVTVLVVRQMTERYEVRRDRLSGGGEQERILALHAEDGVASA